MNCSDHIQHMHTCTPPPPPLPKHTHTHTHTHTQDALSSILVARDGFGDMAVSNAIGSNVFDINLGMGLPFLISICIQRGRPFDLLSHEQQVLQITNLVPRPPLVLVLLFAVSDTQKQTSGEI